MAVFKKQWVYWIDYYVHGRRKRERIGPDKKLAETVLKKRKVEIVEGKYLDKRRAPRCTFHELAQRYLEWARVNHRGFASMRSRVGHLQTVFGHTPLIQVTPLMVNAYVTERSAVRKPGTVNREVQLLHHMFQKAMAWWHALQNPVTHQKPLRVDNRRLRYLSHEEIPRLLAAADESLRPLVLTALHTGLRRGELLSLIWQDVDFSQGVLRLVHTKNGERREIPMTDRLQEALQSLPHRLNSESVFLGHISGLSDLRRRFHRALTKAGIEAVVFHDLRHTFASHLVMAGVDLITIKEVLGHKDFKMTLRYAHLAPDYKPAAMTRLDTYMDTRSQCGIPEYASTN
jgi:integrase